MDMLPLIAARQRSVGSAAADTDCLVLRGLYEVLLPTDCRAYGGYLRIDAGLSW